MEKIYRKLVAGIREYFRKAGFKKAVIGLSGGLDSAVTCFLAVKALGNKNVTALLMPEKGISSKLGVKDAVNLAKSLKIKYHIVSINGFAKNYKKLPWKDSHVSETNSKARVRATILYHYANTHNALVVGTSNKTELEIGFFTKHGDGATDLEPIGDLYKTDEYKLAKYLKLPDEFLTKAPSAELYKGHTDEEEIGASYLQIDAVLKGKLKKGKIADKIRKRIAVNKHKTEPAYVIGLNRKVLKIKNF